MRRRKGSIPQNHLTLPPDWDSDYWEGYDYEDAFHQYLADLSCGTQYKLKNKEPLDFYEEELVKEYPGFLAMYYNVPETLVAGLLGGKAAEYLISKHGFIKLSFAEPLKRGVQLLIGFQDEELFGNDVQKTSINTFVGVSPRKILQYLGTDIFRNNPLFSKCQRTQNTPWIAKAQETIDQLPPSSRVIIDDVRFPDELGIIPVEHTALIQRNVQNISQAYNQFPSLALLPSPPTENVMELMDRALEVMVPYYTHLDDETREKMQKELFRIMDVEMPTYFQDVLCWKPFAYTEFLKHRHELLSRPVENDESTHQHASETQVLNVPKIIENNGTLEELYVQLDEWVSKLI